LWVIHFEPEAQDQLLALLDDDELAVSLARAGVAGVLCGHTHLQCRHKKFAGSSIYVCGTTSQYFAPEGNYLQIIDVEVNPGAPPPVTIDFRPFRFGRSDDGKSGFFPT
jgi:hypothetical protein